MVIHVRLGDLTRNYIDLEQMFLKATLKIVKKHDLDILIVTENPEHFCINNLKEKLKEWS